MAQTTFIYNASDVETIQPTSTCNEFAREVEGISIRFRRNVGRFSVRTIYHRMAQFIDAHPALTNLWIGGWATAFVLYIFLYY